MSNPKDKENIGKAIGCLAGGLYVVTLKSSSKEGGMVASWIQQAGFEPPMLTIAIGKDRYHKEILNESGKFVVNVMSKDNNKLMGTFFKPPAEGKSIFDGLKTREGETKTPILTDSVAYMECVYKTEMESGDHVIVLAEIIAGERLNDNEPASHFRKNGFQY